jgi:transposase InsO family protein
MRIISLAVPHMEKGERHRKYDPEFKAEKVRQIHEESLRSYGSPRILRVLQGEGIQCGKHRLEKLMHEDWIVHLRKGSPARD